MAEIDPQLIGKANRVLTRGKLTDYLKRRIRGAIERYETAVDLTKGPDPERSKFWELNAALRKRDLQKELL